MSRRGVARSPAKRTGQGIKRAVWPAVEERARPWNVSFDDHTAYLWLADLVKRKQLAKGGARLAEILNTIWP
jgi:hypothetical protein